MDYDTTDHFNFLCPDCGCRLRIRNIRTYPKACPRAGSATRFFLQCPMCKGDGYRKIYWNNGDMCEDSL